MKAFVLAAGFGTRLGALTKQTPKCLISVQGKPLIRYALENLQRAGVTTAVVNLHYLADQVTKYFTENPLPGIQIEFSFEPTILGTGGGLLAAQKLLENGDSFFVHNADIYSELDLRKLLDAHSSGKHMATMAVAVGESAKQLIFDQRLQLVDWQSDENEHPLTISPSGSIRREFLGISVLSPAVFSYLRSFSGSFSLLAPLLEAARKQERIAGFDVGSTPWTDVGTPERLSELENYLHRPC